MRPIAPRPLAATLAAILASLASAQTLPDRPITRAEVIAAVRIQFAAIDANHDGAVTPAEFAAYRQRQAGAGTATGNPFGHVGSHWFEHADTAGTGRVTLAEAEARPLQLFDMADVNGDGVVSVEERHMAEALRSLTGR